MLQYTSVLNVQYNDDLEELMFFNPGQQKALKAIVDSVDLFGSPSVYFDNEHLRVKVDNLEQVQSLFALDGRKLVGVIVYSRILQECFTVIQIAVHEDYSSSGKFSNAMLVMRMLDVLRKNARRIKGVNAIRLINGEAFKDFPV